MKRLLILNGTMGVGKTTTSRALQRLLPGAVFLDGDWCWDANPFIVNDETKSMVLDNICYLLNSFIHCSAYENIIFCWVMHEKKILEDVLAGLDKRDLEVSIFTLMCSEDALVQRLERDIREGKREASVIPGAVERLPLYERMDTKKIEVSRLSAEAAARRIAENITGSAGALPGEQIEGGREEMISYHEFGSERISEVLEMYRRAGWNAYLADDKKLIRAFDNTLYILGAFEEEKLIGFIRCVGDGEHIIFVEDLIVDVPYKRQGIGKALLQKTMERYADVRMFTLLTDRNDETDNAFYQAMGMKQYEENDLVGYLR